VGEALGVYWNSCKVSKGIRSAMTDQTDAWTATVRP
jgi:hypothetical protein